MSTITPMSQFSAPAMRQPAFPQPAEARPEDSFTPDEARFMRFVDTSVSRQAPDVTQRIELKAGELTHQGTNASFVQLAAQLGTWVCSSPALIDTKAQSDVANSLLGSIAQSSNWGQVANNARMAVMRSEPSPTSIATLNQAFTDILAGQTAR